MNTISAITLSSTDALLLPPSEVSVFELREGRHTTEAVVLVCGPNEIRLVLQLPFDSVTWIYSFVFLAVRAANGETSTRSLPSSRYSTKSDVCDLFDDRIVVLSLA